MGDIMDNVEKARNGEPYGLMLTDISELTSGITFNYVGSVHNVKELDDLPKHFLKDFNIVVVTEDSEGIDGTKGTYYYLNHKWNKWIDPVSTEISFIDGINVFHNCLYDMLQFGLNEWVAFADVAKAFNVTVFIPDKRITGTLEQLLLNNKPIVIYNAYKAYMETRFKTQKKRTKALNNIIDAMNEFDISEDDIHERIKHFNNDKAPDEAIEEDQKDEDRFKWEQSADCTKCLQRPTCLPRKDVQNLVKVHGCHGFIPDKSR